MGERVVVNPRADDRPAESPRAPRGPSADPAPLDYGHGTRAGDVGRRIIAELRQRLAGAAQFAGMLTELIGGPRQLIFAVGLMFLAGGFADALSRGDDGVFAACVGGLLIGLVLPVPGRKG
jgi:hypothetical protein